ncbi:hypothetical protein JG688_00001612 [Phytophthora aleatoria]|uniref:Uncharacterized protein n=1 Tax=Phytophthora aleatoria TaxID=2496075 RepID=A0A8J5JBH0_9STRA|nr:hypothetical protein JG688_00001612 [Phytophthora aleatoria]
MKSVMEALRGSCLMQYEGWYPKLFYAFRGDSGKRDVLVTDVHTDCPSAEHGDPGPRSRRPLVPFFVVNEVNAGPALSSYEVVTPIDKRLDEEFEEQLPMMSTPLWAQQSYLCISDKLIEDNAENELQWELETHLKGPRFW